MAMSPGLRPSAPGRLPVGMRGEPGTGSALGEDALHPPLAALRSLGVPNRIRRPVPPLAVIDHKEHLAATADLSDRCPPPGPSGSEAPIRGLQPKRARHWGTVHGSLTQSPGLAPGAQRVLVAQAHWAVTSRGLVQQAIHPHDGRPEGRSGKRNIDAPLDARSAAGSDSPCAYRIEATRCGGQRPRVLGAAAPLIAAAARAAATPRSRKPC